MVTSAMDSLVRLWDDKGVMINAKKDHKEAVLVAKWNWELDIFASAGLDKKIIVSLNLTLLVVG